jgi:transposase
VQDQNPDSNEWNQQAKQAAAQTYRVSLSTIDEIIREGATKGWMQPDPP